MHTAARAQIGLTHPQQPCASELANGPRGAVALLTRKSPVFIKLSPHTCGDLPVEHLAKGVALATTHSTSFKPLLAGHVLINTQRA